MGESEKTWKRILTEGALAPLGMPAEHFKSFFRNNFPATGSALDRFLGNSFISSLTAVGGVAGGFYAGSLAATSFGSTLAGFALGAAAVIPAYVAGSIGCLGVIAAGSVITGGVHGTFKVLRNIFEHKDMIYGPDPEKPAPKAAEPAPAKATPAEQISATPGFSSAAAQPSADENLKKLDKIIGPHKRRPPQNT